MRCDKFKYRMEKNFDWVLRLKLWMSKIYNKYRFDVFNKLSTIYLLIYNKYWYRQMSKLELADLLNTLATPVASK